MSRTTLVIVESPTKAKKIAGYLGSGFVVKASMGHVSDLPNKDLAVDLDTMEERYEVKNTEVISKLRAISKGAGRVLLASDPDREGEAIAWHLSRALGLGDRAERVEFHAITEEAVKAAVASPRQIDLDRVDAQRARRVLDRIVGYETSSKVCWPAGAKSAGRVQTPALHLLCERERAIAGFVGKTFWTLTASYDNGVIATALGEEDDAPKPTGGDEEPSPDDAGGSDIKPLPTRRFASEEDAIAYRDLALREIHKVSSLRQARASRSPAPPYTTSTCYQDAKRKLNLGTDICARHLQALFENGLITYHRTDSTRVDPAAAAAAKAYLTTHHPRAVALRAPVTRTKAGAQDAHEAIRPTQLGTGVQTPAGTGDLYRMIRARFLASQCRPALFDQTQAIVSAGETTWVADGSVLVEPGFLEVWGEYARAEDTVLPPLAEGDVLGVDGIAIDKRKTSPPTRYDDASLTRALELSGIGRPSTFASTIATLQQRGYASPIEGRKKKMFLQATPLGLRLDDLITEAFPELASEQYTAEMEASLDLIADPDDHLTRPRYLREWYDAFAAALKDANRTALAYASKHGLKTSGGRGEPTKTTCDRCGAGTYIKLKAKDDRSFLKCESCEMTRPVRAKVRQAACPECRSSMIEYHSKDGGRTYWDCVNRRHPTTPCQHRESAEGVAVTRYEATPSSVPCPKCKKGKVVARTNGKVSLVTCSTDKCSFVANHDVRHRPGACPHCKGTLVTRERKRDKNLFWACVQYPECKHAETYEGADTGKPLLS